MHGMKSHLSRPKRLRVYYGWRKLGKSIKKESLTVIFLNDRPGPRFDKDGYDGVTRWMHVVYSRWQTDEEMSDAELFCHMYAVHEIMLDDKEIQGSLELALQANYNADRNNVSVEERELIRNKLREAYLASHPGYHEPHGVQLFIDFN